MAGDMTYQAAPMSANEFNQGGTALKLQQGQMSLADTMKMLNNKPQQASADAADPYANEFTGNYMRGNSGDPRYSASPTSVGGYQVQQSRFTR